MGRPRVIPALLVDGRRRLVKTRRFTDPTYVGDPCNVIRIFNEKQVDEIVVLDIAATSEGREPDYELARILAGECFMPLSWGGGIANVRHAERLFAVGIEKVVINSAATDPALISACAREFGSQSVVVSMDVASHEGGYQVRTHRGRRSITGGPENFAARVVEAGAGELLLGAIDRDGGMQGYDLELVRLVSRVVSVPVVALGGARSLADMRAVIVAGAAAAAAGAFFVFIGRLRAVLVSYPSEQDLIREIQAAGAAQP